MSEKSTAELLSALESSLAVPQPDEFVLQTSLNEAWFSNTLAWLLNPRGSHGFGVSFCEAFVALVARKRSERPSDPDSYVRRATFLKFDKAGPGVGATGFSFQNAAALREYYLSRSVDQRDDRRTRFCDVVLVDLDSHDSFFLAIENKLFTSDHDEQLREYRAAIEAKYERATVRELVYLTLCGDPPANDGAGQSERRHWVRLSWTDDVLAILKQRAGANRAVGSNVSDLIVLLEWLQQITNLDRVTKPQRIRLKRALVRAAAECLFEELTRLDRPDGGQWQLEPPTQLEPPISRGERIRYTVRTAAYLSVELTPGLAITVQGRQQSGRAEFDKIVVPFGAHPDQVTNLLDIAARDVYHKFFKNPISYLGSGRRLRATWTEKEREHRQLFEFAHKHRYAIKAMLLQSPGIREAVGVSDEEAAEAQ